MEWGIRAARPHEHQRLTELTLLSKDHWGFGREQIEAWREELTITPAYLAAHTVCCICLGEEIAGYYACIHLNTREVCLDNLFVHPDWIGQGLGARLMDACLKQMHTEGYQRIRLESEPQAVGFYQKFGFRTYGHKASSIPGRNLPLMALAFEREADSPGDSL